MKCPRCGAEMVIDQHRKYPLPMCYECGYMEGRNFDPITSDMTNYQKVKQLNFNELVAFLASRLGVDEQKLVNFLNSRTDDGEGRRPNA